MTEPDSLNHALFVSGATNNLVAVLQRYSTAVAELDRADLESPDYSTLGDELDQALETWNAAIFRATGVLPLPELEDEDEDGRQGDRGRLLTVVSRFDMAIDDPTALVAFASSLPDDDEGPTPAGVVGAIDRVVVAHGQPWWELPGVEVLGGGVAIIDPDDAADPSEYSDELSRISAPRGSIAFFEGFTGV